MPAQSSDLLKNKKLLKALRLGKAATGQKNSLEALLKILLAAAGGSGNPHLTARALGLPLAGAVANAFTRSPRELLEKEILKARKERLNDLRRHAKGKFKPAERQNIQRANETILNRVLSNVAQRGLETSGAGSQVLAQAAQAPFQQVQQRAQAQLDDYKLTQKLMQEDEGFVKDLEGLTKYFANLENRSKKDPALLDLNKTITGVQKLLAKLTQLREGKP